ncbi:MAG: hypothetical protein M4D80_38270 [Myxococcota bacterium]|nr:hypothetical protein [Deltaproteobacteria bacterium]MDQ3341041.1 hypothetical protein [Myxococcota bacterium]
MRMVAALAALLVISGVAYAQPGNDAPPPPTYPPQPQQQPGYPPPPQQYQPGYGYQVPLTPEEHELLMDGEISSGQHIGGGVAALFLGFGVGQAVQGRWSDTGWIFTLGEAASFAVLIGGMVRTFDDCQLDGQDNCDHSDGPPLMIAGLIGFTVFRIWEIVDAFGGPTDHNRRVRELKFRMGVPVRVGDRFMPYVNKTRDGGGVAGLQLRF